MLRQKVGRVLHWTFVWQRVVSNYFLLFLEKSEGNLFELVAVQEACQLGFRIVSENCMVEEEQHLWHVVLFATDFCTRVNRVFACVLGFANGR